MRIVVTRRIDDAALGKLKSAGEVEMWDCDLPPDPDELRRLLTGADGALTLLTDRIDGSLLDQFPRLKVVSNLAVGFDNIDVAACTQRGVAACTTPNVLTQTTAEFAFTLLMAVARQIVPAARAARNGEWETWYPFRFLGRDLAGSTLGIVGMGRIGSAVATMAASFGMRVIFADARNGSTIGTRVDLDELLRTSDIVSLHVPLTSETRHLINSKTLALMKPDAILINTARGPVIDTNALVDALEQGRLMGVGLDVTDPEPLPADHPLYGFDRVTIVPHIASATAITRYKMSDLAAENVIAVLTHREPPHCLNPEVLQRV
jgi:glyoxylate reductase